MRITGWSCVLIGALHLFGGLATIPGQTGRDPTLDSQHRFHGAVFAGYGLAWILASRVRPVPLADVDRLAATMALGAAGRAVSTMRRGRPHWFQEVLAVVEVLVPSAFMVLSVHERRRRGILARTRRVG